MAEAAARLHDPIEHTRALTGLIAGAIIGGAVATVAVVFAPVTVPVLIGGAIIAGSTVGVAALGETLGSLSWAKIIEGEIAPTCSSNVFINGQPAARAHVDFVDCRRHPAHPPIAQGSSSVFINGLPAARKGDRAGCDAVIASGSPNVFIGGDTITTDEISPEVPEFVHTTMLVVGVASAVILFGPEAAALGLIGGIVGGTSMNYVGGKLFGEGSDGQKLLAFGGGLAGGWAGSKGGSWFARNYEVTPTGLGMNGGGIRISRRPAKPIENPIKQNEVTTYQDFKDRSVIGDKLEGHEVWQHANLNENGLAISRHSSDASKNNPVIALEHDAHVQVNKAQSALDARNQTPLENIESNVKILRDLEVAPQNSIDKIHQMAIDHAKSLGFD